MLQLDGTPEGESIWLVLFPDSETNTIIRFYCHLPAVMNIVFILTSMLVQRCCSSLMGPRSVSCSVQGRPGHLKLCSIENGNFDEGCVSDLLLG